MNSPWGHTQTRQEIERGVTWVTTASHGGLMVGRTAQRKLSANANACAGRYREYLYFEEDCAYAVAFYDVPEWARTSARLDSEEWLKYADPDYPDHYNLRPEAGKLYLEKFFLSIETDDQIRTRYRMTIMRYNPEYFGLGGCTEENKTTDSRSHFGLSCVQRDVPAAQMCEPCKRTQQAIETTQLSELVQAV